MVKLIYFDYSRLLPQHMIGYILNLSVRRKDYFWRAKVGLGELAETPRKVVVSW